MCSMKYSDYGIKTIKIYYMKLFYVKTRLRLIFAGEISLRTESLFRRDLLGIMAHASTEESVCGGLKLRNDYELAVFTDEFLPFWRICGVKTHITRETNL